MAARFYPMWAQQILALACETRKQRAKWVGCSYIFSIYALGLPCLAIGEKLGQAGVEFTVSPTVSSDLPPEEVSLGVKRHAFDTVWPAAYTRPGKTIELVRGDWKAVKIGHGPATVIGRSARSASARGLRGFGAPGPKVRTIPNRSKLLAFARKGSGAKPRSLTRLFCF